MKKNLFFLLTGIILLSFATLQSCKKDDTTPPVISLSGSNPMIITLNSGTMSDPGATANDDEDGTVNVSSNWNWGTNPNPNMADTYYIVYTAADASGNETTETRTVNVENSAKNLAGNYLVWDTCGTTQYFNYAQTITASNSVNGRIHFSKFADYSGNTGIYADITGASITLPSQTANDIGSFIEDHQFNGTGSFVTSPGIVLHLNYTDNNLSTSSTANCSAWFVKQ